MTPAPDAKTPKYRVFWTWDYGTRWDDQFYFHGYGAVGRNDRRDYFLDDYRRMVDFASLHGINGIVIWGALRSYNSGEDQLRELLAYAESRDVRILPGCGTHGYGGVYYDSRPWLAGSPEGHPASLATWLDTHPEYAAVGPDGKPYNHPAYTRCACPSRRETLEWFIESVQWLFSEFPVGGIQIEVGDYAVCHCELCRKRRGGTGNLHFSIDDMTAVYGPVVEAVRAMAPDAWVICETYSSFARPREPEKQEFGAALTEQQQAALADLPEGAVLQWVMDRPLVPAEAQDWTPETHPPSRENIARIHSGSQWCRDGIEGWGVHKIGDLIRRSRSCGLNGVSIFGEESPASPPNEANYLVFTEFSGFGKPNPECDMDLFFSQTLDPLFGGPGLAGRWEQIYAKGHFLRDARKTHPSWKSRSMDPKLTGDGDFGVKARSMGPQERCEHTGRLIGEAHSVGSRLSGEPCRRWSWLENWLWRAEYLHQTDHDIHARRSTC
jgi:hypothetical protein